ncbi:hypothetical protein H113_00736 [Trichophyton rubrum MR1459]|uniref:Uncharacterized protein n=1 Tax=Trichophyton rubrum (strain ATCC MYA-4607 / CBS 118892) TaxID=559305 RepID=A0A080WR82_TRIRC|nr:uncharacterized protein TERG_12605 [Trichophyton rubrum CBS 118892]EZF99626.1 hypothetical protein H113_00736 [Trichophyton rubrum MR1459]EZG10452.1 hypothetical protein H106_00530 [Trichophyton rubrum CBS 735.88]KFL62855.1 hypothetical protein TERG_12605 [Trichophyton rubrum CBS 118892]
MHFVVTIVAVGIPWYIPKLTLVLGSQEWFKKRVQSPESSLFAFVIIPFLSPDIRVKGKPKKNFETRNVPVKAPRFMPSPTPMRERTPVSRLSLQSISCKNDERKKSLSFPSEYSHRHKCFHFRQDLHAHSSVILLLIL